MLPRVIIHNAVSMNGQTTGFPVDLGLYYGLVSRWKENATLAGADTLLAAAREFQMEEDENAPDKDPRKRCADCAPDFPPPDPKDPRPLLVVPDSRGRIKFWNSLRQQPYWRGVLVLCSHSTPRKHIKYLENGGIKYRVLGEKRVDLKAALEMLRTEFRAKTIRVDSGGALNTALLQAGLVNEVSLLIHPCVPGKGPAHAFFQMPISKADVPPLNLRLVHYEKLKGGILWIIYRIPK